MHDDRAMIRGRNARKRALHRSGVSISLSRLSDRTIVRSILNILRLEFRPNLQSITKFAQN